METNTAQAKGFWGVGRRKTAIARVQLRQGSGRVLVNGMAPEDYFGGLFNAVDEIFAPLETAKVKDSYDVFVNVTGGGKRSQSGAIVNGIAKALGSIDSTLKLLMRQHGFVTRDARIVERKKPGRPKARKRFQYSKR